MTAGPRRRASRSSIVVACAVFIATACATAGPSHNSRNEFAQGSDRAAADHPYSGGWVTADGTIRQQLLPNGRYDEARGERESAYTGRYEVRGNHIEYWDDTGFTADGTFVTNDELHHGGMIFYRVPE